MDAQLTPVNGNTLEDYAELLRNQPCPVCNSTSEKLNATQTGTIMSFIIFTNYRKAITVACPACLDKANNKAILTSALLGWWGFPWGLIRTPQALLLNNKMKKQNHVVEPNDVFKAFIYNRVGLIEANRNNPENLKMLITDHR